MDEYVQVRISPQARRAARIAANLLDTTMQQFLTDAVLAYIRSRDDLPPNVTAGIPTAAPADPESHDRR